MKKLLLIILIITTIGCTRYNDLSDLTIIKSIGITYDNEYSIYAQIIDHIDEFNHPVMKTIKENSQNIEEGFNKIKEKINKTIYLSHIDLLVLSDNLTSNNYQEIMDYFINNHDFRNDFYTVFSPNVNLLLEKPTYDAIETFIKTKENNENIIIKNFDDIIKEFIDNQTITLTKIGYQDEIVYLGNIQYNKKEDDYVSKN